MRPVGTAEELQRRRLRAVELVEQGESPAEVARFLGCGRSSVYTWVKLAKESLGALAAKPHPGPAPRLTAEQLTELEGLLLQGAVAHGWRPGARRPSCGVGTGTTGSRPSAPWPSARYGVGWASTSACCPTTPTPTARIRWRSCGSSGGTSPGR